MHFVVNSINDGGATEVMRKLFPWRRQFKHEKKKKD
jgi:hypothetical protein